MPNLPWPATCSMLCLNWNLAYEHEVRDNSTPQACTDRTNITDAFAKVSQEHDLTVKPKYLAYQQQDMPIFCLTLLLHSHAVGTTCTTSMPGVIQKLRGILRGERWRQWGTHLQHSVPIIRRQAQHCFDAGICPGVNTREETGGEAARLLLVAAASTPLRLINSAVAVGSLSSGPCGTSCLASSSLPSAGHICTGATTTGARALASASPKASSRHICKGALHTQTLDGPILSINIHLY